MNWEPVEEKIKLQGGGSEPIKGLTFTQIYDSGAYKDETGYTYTATEDCMLSLTAYISTHRGNNGTHGLTILVNGIPQDLIYYRPANPTSTPEVNAAGLFYYRLKKDDTLSFAAYKESVFSSYAIYLIIGIAPL